MGVKFVIPKACLCIHFILFPVFMYFLYLSVLCAYFPSRSLFWVSMNSFPISHAISHSPPRAIQPYLAFQMSLRGWTLETLSGISLGPHFSRQGRGIYIDAAAVLPVGSGCSLPGFLASTVIFTGEF